VGSVAANAARGIAATAPRAATVLKSLRRVTISPIDGWTFFISLLSSTTSEKVEVAPSLRYYDRNGDIELERDPGELRALGDAGKAREKLAQFPSAVKHAGLHSAERAVKRL
jgi:hypothetical protein